MGEPGVERWVNLELKLVADVGFVGVPNGKLKKLILCYKLPSEGITVKGGTPDLYKEFSILFCFSNTIIIQLEPSLQKASCSCPFNISVRIWRPFTAGKSSLLAVCSNAKPKVADYPFTTVVPQLGMWEDKRSNDGRGLCVADIPGLLEGAHSGVGLGLAFLRHIQRCRVILHILDGNSPDPLGDYMSINQELLLFNPTLAEKAQVRRCQSIEHLYRGYQVFDLKPFQWQR